MKKKGDRRKGRGRSEGEGVGERIRGGVEEAVGSYFFF